MALALNDRVQQTGSANTTVSFTLTGAVTGFQSFAVVGNGNTTYYSSFDTTGNWEVGVGTYSTTGPTLARTTILASSNSGAAVTFVGTVNVFVTYPSSKSVNLDASGNASALGTVSSGTWQGTTVGVAYGGTGVTASSGVNSVVLRDANANVTFNNFIAGATATTASGGTTVLTVASARTQILVGSTTHTFQLPDATTLQLGQSFIVVNNSSGTLTVTNNGSATIETIPSGGVSQLGATNIATSSGTWGIYSFLPGTYNFNTTSADFGNATISNAVWNGTTIASGYGGTGLTTFTAANNALYSTSASALAAGTLPAEAGGTGITSPGTAGNVLTSTGTAWVSSTPFSGASISNDTSTATNLYPLFAAATSGTPTTIYTSNAKLLYKPSTGELQASQLVASNGLVVNSTTISSNYTVAAGTNANSIGPVTVANGVTVTVTNGQRWVVF